MMEHMNNIADVIRTLEHDIRAEVIINSLQENNDITEEEYVISKEGQFSRAYRFDVLDSRIVDYNYDSTQMLSLDLSRDSMYDMLPEGITHSSKNDTLEKDVDVMIREYKNQKKQQRSARKFFQPFENEMFRFGVSTENFENEFLYGLNGSAAPEMFYDFWNIDRHFPPLLVSKFIRLLPFAYKIVGNILLAAHILSVLLEESVVVNDRDYQEYADESQGISLGETRLGLDSITGTRYDDYSRHLDIKIGPLEKSSFTDFIHDGNKKRFTEMFYEHFFPLEVEIKTIIVLPRHRQNFEFNTAEAPVLGYNTNI
jgi:Type VI secretion, TssG